MTVGNAALVLPTLLLMLAGACNPSHWCSPQIFGSFQTKHLGIFLGLTMMSLLTVDPENAPKFDDFENIVVEPNELAMERLNGIVSDYIRWGII